jgi:hypothetical protein
MLYIKRIGAKLGKQVTLLEIENAQHDIFLSRKIVRAFDEMFTWLNNMELVKKKNSGWNYCKILVFQEKKKGSFCL